MRIGRLLKTDHRIPATWATWVHHGRVAARGEKFEKWWKLPQKLSLHRVLSQCISESTSNGCSESAFWRL